MSATKLSSKCQSDTDFICVKTVFHKHLNIGFGVGKNSGHLNCVENRIFITVSEETPEM